MHSGKVYSIQYYAIKFVSDMWQVGGFLWVFLKVALNTITHHLKYINIIFPKEQQDI
jgi:hypothetical protein